MIRAISGAEWESLSERLKGLKRAARERASNSSPDDHCNHFQLFTGVPKGHALEIRAKLEYTNYFKSSIARFANYVCFCKKRFYWITVAHGHCLYVVYGHFWATLLA